jgi:hypothetical protein
MEPYRVPNAEEYSKEIVSFMMDFPIKYHGECVVLVLKLTLRLPNTKMLIMLKNIFMKVQLQS